MICSTDQLFLRELVRRLPAGPLKACVEFAGARPTPSAQAFMRALAPHPWILPMRRYMETRSRHPWLMALIASPLFFGAHQCMKCNDCPMADLARIRREYDDEFDDDESDAGPEFNMDRMQ